MHARTCTHMHARTCTHAQVFRHLYSAGSVYCYHLYINGEDQPGLGWNYQTAAVVCMVGGRLLANNNMLKIDFLRRIELPGYFVLTVRDMGTNM